MKTLRRFLTRFTSWTRTARDEERLRAEIAEHIALQTADNLRAGMSPAEARRHAMFQFGGVEAVKEEYRDQRTLPFLETLVLDTRYAARRLRKAPAFTLTTVLTLALGIGATTSIFTLVYAVLMKSLAVAKPNELYRLGKTVHCCQWGGYAQWEEFSLISDELYVYFRDHTKGFAELAAFRAASSLFGVKRAGSSEPARTYPGKYVSGNYFEMFGVSAIAGRMLAPADDSPSAPPVAVISYRLWQKYGSATSVIGSVVNFDNQPFTVVGVTPAGFFGDTLNETPPEFYIPLSAEPLMNPETSLLHRPDSYWLEVIGRIQPGAHPAALEAQMRIELKQWLQSHWNDMDDTERAIFPKQTLYLSPGGAGIVSMRQSYEHWLHILMWVAAFVLAIVCANVANLMLVRGLEQRQQSSLSIALGARVSRVVRQALTESVLLSLAGGAAGLALAFAGTRLILHFAFPTLPYAAGVPISASPSMPVLFFAFAVSLLTGIAFGIGPAWMAARVDPIEALRGVNRVTRRSGSLQRKALVVLQAALSLVLLSASGLLTAALRNLENLDFGFEQARRTIVGFAPELGGYRSAQLDPLYQRIHDSMAAIPGVESVAICGYSPQNGDGWNDSIYVEGHPTPGPSDDHSAWWDRVTGGYFAVVGNPIVRGRGITDRDVENAPRVAVINQAFARKFFPNEDPIGKHFGRAERGADRQVEIVGIARDARNMPYDLDKPVPAFFYVPEAQYDVFPNHPEDTKGDASSHFLNDIVVVTKPGATLSDSEVRRVMATIDSNLPVIRIVALRDQVAGQFGQQRLIARLTSFFGALSLILAALGLYGVTAYNAGRRTGEIGLRMALGAGRRQVVGLVLRGALGLILLGLLIGLLPAVESGTFLGAQLYGMNPYNPVVIAISVSALALSALIASLIPALRASRISPMEALRAE
jgi:predicted permease